MELSGPFDDNTGYEDCKASTCSRRSSVHISRKTSWGTPIPGPSSQKPSDATVDASETFENVDLDADCRASHGVDGDPPWNTVENIIALGLSLSTEGSLRKQPSILERFSLEDADRAPTGNQQPAPQHRFDKWLRTLQKKGVQRRQTMSGNMDSAALKQDPLISGAKEQAVSGHKKSLSGSSLGFVTAMKSASISLASFSVAPLSRKTGISSRHQRTERGSRASNGGFRLSEDSASLARAAIMDEAVWNRSVQRRQVLEEIISTEEGYITDIRFLMNVYVTLLASIPTISLNLRASINQNLNEIVELHEELLRDLHRVVPYSEYSQTAYSRPPIMALHRSHHRLRSIDTVPEPSTDLSSLHKIPGTTAEACVAAEVAKVFGQKMQRFFVYEEYGAKYEMMVRDVASTYRTIPEWEMYQKGLEALAVSLSSIKNQKEHSSKSLTVGDLLVKPIQRICRYPLLFAELLKQTPVCDCPDSHLEIEKVLLRLRETTSEINKATNDPRMKATMEKTWVLQDRLVLADQVHAHSKNVMRTLGHIHLCGVLYIAWQTREGVDGQYMISLLYRDHLVLAIAGKTDPIYNIQAIIGLSEMRLEEVDNGRGLQCHTAPFSWKLVFECDHQLFEIILSASSPKEELEWRSRLIEKVSRDHNDMIQQAFFTISSLRMKPMGTVFGKPGTIARRISIHRATTIGPKSSLCQLIIKNTTTLRDIPQHSSPAYINRSQSLLTTNRIPVLAPSRIDRVRLENLLSDVWTRDILPFPGMTGRARSENLVRTSASSMMRKLSVASIASNFTKRSGSMASLSSIHRPIDQKFEVDRPKNPYTGGWEVIVPEKSSIVGSEDTTNSHLSVIQDENYPLVENTSSAMGTAIVDSPVASLKRLATLRIKRSWQPDGNRIITPPLRASSANSINNNRTPPVTELPGEANEIEDQVKHSIWAKATSMNKSTYAEGIKSFFR